MNYVQDVPNRDILQEGMELAGVKKSFVVLSPYWWNVESVAQQLNDFLMQLSVLVRIGYFCLIDEVPKSVLIKMVKFSNGHHNKILA